MRTSGTSRSEVWMTAVPVGILVVFVVFMFGGPGPFLKTIEAMFQSMMDWVVMAFH